MSKAKPVPQPLERGRRVLSVTIHDCKVQTFRVGGHGGQKVNKTSSGVRVTHEPSGAIGESRETRSQHQNKRAAFIKMTETKAFQTWMRRQLGHDILVEARVAEDMRPNNLLIEYKVNGKWTTIPN